MVIRPRFHVESAGERLRRHGDGEPDRHEVGEPQPQPCRVHRHRVLTGAVQPEEQLLHLIHAHEPERTAGDHAATGSTRGCCRPGGCRRTRARRPHPRTSSRSEMPHTSTTVPRTTSVSRHTRNSRSARQQLRVDRFGEHVVERALTHVGHHTAHVRFDHEPDDPADDREHAHHHQQLWPTSSRRACRCDRRPASSTTSPVPSATIDWISWITKFARYCSSFITSIAQMQTHQPQALEPSALQAIAELIRIRHPFTAVYAFTPRRHMRFTPIAPIAIHIAWRSSPSTSSPFGDRADQRRDREPERRLEREVVRDVLHPVGHQRHRQQSARQQQFERRSTSRRSRSTLVVQNVIMPSIQSSSERMRYAPQMATAKVAIWATLGSSTGRNSRLSTAAMRDPHHDHDHLPAGEETEVVVDRVDRAHELRRQPPFADALLPAERGEDDVHVPHQRPDDVVRRERAGRVAADRHHPVDGRSSTRRRGR